MARYALVGCGSAKRSGAHPARDLYKSNYFGGKARWSDTYADVWWVLSGKFGLLAPDRVIREYDVEVPDDVDVAAWQERVGEQVRARIPLTDSDTLWVLAGKGYLESTPAGIAQGTEGARLRDVLEQIPGRLVTPFDYTGGMFEQQRWLSQCVKQGRLVEPDGTPDGIEWPPDAEGEVPSGGPMQSRLSGF
jgi:hypothetical protein